MSIRGKPLLRRDSKGRFKSISLKNDKQRDKKNDKKNDKKKKNKSVKELYEKRLKTLKRMNRLKRKKSIRALHIPRQSTVTTVKNINPPIENTRVYGLMHANWCPHCTNMRSDWNQLKSETAKKGNWDCVDLEEQQIKGQLSELNRKYQPVPEFQAPTSYPHIWKMEPETHNIVVYSGDRSLDSLRSFLDG